MLFPRTSTLSQQHDLTARVHLHTRTYNRYFLQLSLCCGCLTMISVMIVFEGVYCWCWPMWGLGSEHRFLPDICSEPLPARYLSLEATHSCSISNGPGIQLLREPWLYGNPPVRTYFTIWTKMWCHSSLLCELVLYMFITTRFYYDLRMRMLNPQEYYYMCQ